ncbi:hypothetical protein CJ030_MR6G006737 [Morella rubra]|uniref:Uncharacterized protein n=1 Tax=Morella rubra TaxID=262757 RepID=A0A6A1V949_9ROSI|nr:hypothetical protein CJ030_MR6G006737 [Morella rubra]
MWRMLTAVKRNLRNRKKSPRVADESILAGGNAAESPISARRQGGGSGFSFLYKVVRSTISTLSCISYPHVNGADGMWASGEFAQMNHLIVSDSMRYAIMM